MNASSNPITDFLSAPQKPAASRGRGTDSDMSEAGDRAFGDMMATREHSQNSPPAGAEKGGQESAADAAGRGEKSAPGGEQSAKNSEKSHAGAENGDKPLATGDTGTQAPAAEAAADSAVPALAGVPIAVTAAPQSEAAVAPPSLRAQSSTAKTTLTAAAESGLADDPNNTVTTAPPAPQSGIGAAAGAAGAGTDLPQTGKSLPPAAGPLAPAAADLLRPPAAAANAGPPPDGEAAAQLPAALAMPTATGRAAQQAAANPLDGLSADLALESDSLQNPRDSAAPGPVLKPAVQQYQAGAEKPALMQTGVETPVGDPKWRGAIQERVMWLAAHNVNSAEIHLDPPELGPLQVKIAVSQDQQVQVSFSSQHASVREALDIGSQRLRELFEGQGLDLLNVDVSDQSFARQSGAQADSGDGPGAEARDEHEAETPPPTQRTSLSLVDHYV